MAAAPSNPSAQVFTSARIASVCSPSMDVQQSSQIRVRNVSLILFHLLPAKKPLASNVPAMKCPLQGVTADVRKSKDFLSRTGTPRTSGLLTTGTSKHIRGFCWMWTLSNHRKMHFRPACLYSVLDRSQRKAETGCPCCGHKANTRAHGAHTCRMYTGQ